jgi:hypothetical protein
MYAGYGMGTMFRHVQIDYSHVWKSIDRIAPIEVIAASEVRKHDSK